MQDDGHTDKHHDHVCKVNMTIKEAYTHRLTHKHTVKTLIYTLLHSPSNRPEKLSVARHLFFFLLRFLASGMSIGWLDGMSSCRDGKKKKRNLLDVKKRRSWSLLWSRLKTLADGRHRLNGKLTGFWLFTVNNPTGRVSHITRIPPLNDSTCVWYGVGCI